MIVPGLNSPSAAWFHPVETLELMGGRRLVAPHESMYTSVAVGNGLLRFCATGRGSRGTGSRTRLCRRGSRGHAFPGFSACAARACMPLPINLLILLGPC